MIEFQWTITVRVEGPNGSAEKVVTKTIEEGDEDLMVALSLDVLLAEKAVLEELLDK